MKPKDKYDLAVEYLTEHPEEISKAWTNPSGFLHGCLFQYVTPSGGFDFRKTECGCLTMIRDGEGRTAWTESLTLAIREDYRLPTTSENITPANLPIFAEWQRRIDEELGRE